MVERVNPVLPISQQCRLLAVSRSSLYHRPAKFSAEDLAIMALIDRQYLARPYYGSRRMAAWLATQGHVVNRKRAQRLMRRLGPAAIYQRPNTSKPAAGHKSYPYLLGGLAIERVNQVWCSDVTYIPMAKGFLYLVAIMDWVSRAVLAWRLSNTLDADFCVEALEEALSRYGRPEICNTDQGSQFTSGDFTGTLKRHEVMISMDGKGRCMDNIFVERLWRRPETIGNICDVDHVGISLTQRPADFLQPSQQHILGRAHAEKFGARRSKGPVAHHDQLAQFRHVQRPAEAIRQDLLEPDHNSGMMPVSVSFGLGAGGRQTVDQRLD